MQDLANTRASIVICRSFFLRLLLSRYLNEATNGAVLISSDRSFQARIVDGMNEL